MIPLCQAGFAYPEKAPALMPLGPPLPPTMFVAAVPAHTVLRFALVAVAAQESFHGISCGHKHGYTLCCCLLPKAVEEPISCRTQCGFAGAETKAHHRVKIVIDDVERRKIGPRTCQRAFRHHQINRCLRGDHPRDLNVQVGFALASGGATDSWIWAIYDNVGRIDWKAEQVAEIRHVLGVDV